MMTLRSCPPLGHGRTARAIVACATMMIACACPASALTLTEAIAAAMAADPELAALEQEQRALAAATGQARLLPNPELQTEVENVAGTGGREGDEAAESTLRLTQRLELGGKRTARTLAAASAADMGAADLELRRRELISAVKTGFGAALAAEGRVLVAKDLEQLANDVVRSVGSAVGAGALSSVARDHARLTVTRANRERVLRERQAAAARAALAATWSDGTADFDELSGRLDVPIVLPARNELLSASLERHPAVLRADAAIAERAAIVSLARANRIPDVTVAAGARHFNDDDDIAAVFSLSAPLPFFDHNQGALAEAEARLARAREERRSADKALRTALWTAYDQCVAAEEQRALIDDSVLPAANRVLATTTTAYRNGLAPYHEVVDAKRTLYELRIDRIDRLEERYVAAVELERISALTLIDTAKGDPR